MSRKLRLFSAVCIVLLVVSIGFNIVLAVSDGTVEPGSDQDPLISKSYVDQSISQLNQELIQQQNQLEQLKKDNESLTQKLADQEAIIKALQNGTNNAGTQTPATPTTGTTTPATVKGTVTASALNVRSQANTTSSVVAKVYKGESLTIISKGAEWYKIKTSKGTTGYVLGKYVSIK